MAANLSKILEPMPGNDAARIGPASPPTPANAHPEEPRHDASWLASQWHFLVEQFRNMPLWVRVLTYLVVLALYCYNSLLPTAMTGTLMQRDLQGKVTVNSKIAFVAAWFEDVELRVRLNEGSGWRVPIMNRGPWKTQHLNFYDKDEKYIDSVESSIPSLMFSGDMALIYDEKTGKVLIDRRRNDDGVLTALLALIPSASAQPADKPAAVAASECDDSCQTIARAANVDPASLRLNPTLTSLAAQQNLNGFRQSLAARAAVDPQKVDWDKIRTVEDFQRVATAYSAAGNISAAVKNILAKASTRDLRLSFGDDSRQLRNARSALKVPADETVLGLLNATFTGDGEEGMLFGTRGIYYHTSWLRRDGPAVAFISYDDLAERAFEEKSSYEVSLDRGQYFVTAKSSISSRQLVGILDQIKEAANAHHSASMALWH